MVDLGLIKWRAIVARGGYWNVKCDLCGVNRATEMHHIVNKGRTVSNPTSRAASEVEELFSMLCPDCHEKAHNPQIAAILLAGNIRRYGRTAVKNAYEAALNHQAGHGGIPFPKRRIKTVKETDIGKLEASTRIRRQIFGI